jgi:hypothetical protein
METRIRYIIGGEYGGEGGRRAIINSQYSTSNDQGGDKNRWSLTESTEVLRVKQESIYNEILEMHEKDPGREGLAVQQAENARAVGF